MSQMPAHHQTGNRETGTQGMRIGSGLRGANVRPFTAPRELRAT
jgi:hypothetical protein